MATTKTAKKVAQTTDVQESALNELFLDELKDIYWAEKHLVKALPKMAKAATSDELRAAVQKHISETENQITRLEQVFSSIDEKAVAVKCEAMAGLLKEAEEIVSETEKGSVTRDAGIISAAQKVEHYEIATYGGLTQLAETLGLTDIKELLGKTLSEEKEADELLSDIAENHVNYEAAEEMA